MILIIQLIIIKKIDSENNYDIILISLFISHSYKINSKKVKTVKITFVSVRIMQSFPFIWIGVLKPHGIYLTKLEVKINHILSG